jgi:hypothetical protein
MTSDLISFAVLRLLAPSPSAHFGPEFRQCSVFPFSPLARCGRRAYSRPRSLFSGLTYNTRLISCEHQVVVRWSSTIEAKEQPPPPEGHLPTVATSQFLRTTREKSLRTPGLTWADDFERGDLDTRQTRKVSDLQDMNEKPRAESGVDERLPGRPRRYEVCPFIVIL